jgi:uncharacterized membrane protein YoaK (UPF0700 family)/anti-anti-sigma regulatory factor
MLSARAYSFRQKSRLAISLSWIGGYTNVVALLAMGTLVSHVTGSATQLGRAIGVGETQRAAFFAYLLFTFTVGAVLSAYLTENARRRGWRSKYVLPVALEALLLALLIIHLNNRIPAAGSAALGLVLYEATGLASLAMGLQNATITKISGAVVRTTHLTGIFTDLGIEGVQYVFWWGDKLAKRRRERAGRLLKISRRHPSALRLLLLLSIAVSFGLGTVVGTVAYSHWGSLSLVAPIAFLTWIIYVDLRTPIADIRELDLLNDPELRLQGIISKLLPAEVVLYRASCPRGGAPHRAPDFQLWLDRVPEHCHVVVLAISPLTRFDSNAVMDLEAAVGSLHDNKKKLILSGITTHQFKALDALGVARMMDVNNLCPDLEFAIARAMVVLEQTRSRPAQRPQLVVAEGAPVHA